MKQKLRTSLLIILVLFTIANFGIYASDCNTTYVTNHYDPTDSEPVGDSKFVKVYIAVPYYNNIKENYYYSDEFYAGWIPLTYKSEVNELDEKYWLLSYSGTVYKKWLSKGNPVCEVDE